MRKLVALILFWPVSCFPQAATAPARSSSALASSGCTPTLLTGATNDWPIWGSANICGSSGGSACTNGLGIYSVADIAGSNNLLQTTSAAQPIYTTGVLNGWPTAVFTRTVDALPITSGITVTGNQTWFAVVDDTSLSFNETIIGGTASASLEWRISTSGKQVLLRQGQAVLATGTHTLSVNTWYTLVAQYNNGTGVYQLYICSSGTCTSDGSGTQAGSISQPVNVVGYSLADLGADIKIAEVAYYASTTTANFATYSQCKYGI